MKKGVHISETTLLLTLTLIHELNLESVDFKLDLKKIIYSFRSFKVDVREFGDVIKLYKYIFLNFYIYSCAKIYMDKQMRLFTI
jgi:hypothetical protein